MRNIAVFLFLVTILFIFSAVFPENCEAESNYSISAGTGFGALFGRTFEYVYPIDTPGELLSELRYDIKRIFYASLFADYAKTDIMQSSGVFAALSFKAGLPGDSGTHENRDWTSTIDDGLTHFSSHSNTLRSLYILDFSFGASFPVKTVMYIKPFLSGSWMHFEFTGKDGYGIYARKTGCTCIQYAHDSTACPGISSAAFDPINNNPFNYLFTGDVIRYQQDWLIFSLGITLGTIKLSPFMFELSFKVSPFSYCAAKDEHLSNNYTFMDFTAWGLFMEPNVKASVTLSGIIISFEASYRSVGKTKGPAYNRPGNSGNFIQTNDAGAALSLLDARLSVSYSF